MGPDTMFRVGRRYQRHDVLGKPSYLSGRVAETYHDRSRAAVRPSRESLLARPVAGVAFDDAPKEFEKRLLSADPHMTEKIPQMAVSYRPRLATWGGMGITKSPAPERDGATQ